MNLRWQQIVDFTRSLRFRLTVWNTLVVFITVVIALIAVREGLRIYLVQEIDAILDAEVKEIILTFEILYQERDELHRQEIENFLIRKEKAHEDRGWHIRWLDEDGKTLWVSHRAPPAPLTELKNKNTDHKVWGSDEYRSIEREINIPGMPHYKIRVGTEMKFIEEDVQNVTNILAPIGLAIWLLAPLGGLWLADQAIRPLSRLIRTTERLRASHLDERLEIRGVGDELDQLAGKINTFLDQIAEYLKKNRDFVANAAHDLRSPLAAIQSSVEVTVEKSRTVEEYEDLLFQINDEVHHLGQLVNQLLQLAETDSPDSELPTEPVRLDDIAYKTVEMFEPVAEERGVRLILTPPREIVVTGVTRQLRQVITNLVDNAIKFTPIGGVVTVDITKDTKPGFALLTVSDTGIGIPPESVGRIFDRFYQVDQSRQRFGEKRGSGLGLSICESIIHAHRGTIKVSSQIGRGTTFSISLPLSTSA